MDATGAERVTQLERAVARSLRLLEAGDADAAREELARVAPAEVPAPLAGALSDQELDAAFADARPEREQMLDADQVALAAVAAADRALEDEADEGAEEPFDSALGGRFATATMAELLEKQGDASGASRIRAALGGAAVAAPAAGGRPSRETVIRTLEAWLANLRQGARA